MSYHKLSMRHSRLIGNFCIKPDTYHGFIMHAVNTGGATQDPKPGMSTKTSFRIQGQCQEHELLGQGHGTYLCRTATPAPLLKRDGSRRAALLGTNLHQSIVRQLRLRRRHRWQKLSRTQWPEVKGDKISGREGSLHCSETSRQGQGRINHSGGPT